MSPIRPRKLIIHPARLASSWPPVRPAFFESAHLRHNQRHLLAKTLIYRRQFRKKRPRVDTIADREVVEQERLDCERRAGPERDRLLVRCDRVFVAADIVIGVTQIERDLRIVRRDLARLLIVVELSLILAKLEI